MNPRDERNNKVDAVFKAIGKNQGGIEGSGTKANAHDIHRWSGVYETEVKSILKRELKDVVDNRGTDLNPLIAGLKDEWYDRYLDEFSFASSSEQHSLKAHDEPSLDVDESAEKGLRVRNYPAKSQHVPCTSWFLGIGIDDYEHWHKLRNAVKDVHDIMQELISRYDVEPDNAILLLNSDATRANIVKQLEELGKRINAVDKLFIYYSGHGHMDRDTEKGFWIPVDAAEGETSEYLRNGTIKDIIEDIDSLHTLLVSDSCFSGTLLTRGDLNSDAAIEELESKASRYVISSGRLDEVYDGSPGTNSPFADSLLRILRDNRDDALNIGKIVDDIMKDTRTKSQQLPDAGVLTMKGHERGQYVFRLVGGTTR